MSTGTRVSMIPTVVYAATCDRFRCGEHQSFDQEHQAAAWAKAHDALHRCPHCDYGERPDGSTCRVCTGTGELELVTTEDTQAALTRNAAGLGYIDPHRDTTKVRRTQP